MSVSETEFISYMKTVLLKWLYEINSVDISSVLRTDIGPVYSPDLWWKMPDLCQLPRPNIFRGCIGTMTVTGLVQFVLCNYILNISETLAPTQCYHSIILRTVITRILPQTSQNCDTGLDLYCHISADLSLIECSTVLYTLRYHFWKFLRHSTGRPHFGLLICYWNYGKYPK